MNDREKAEAGLPMFKSEMTPRATVKDRKQKAVKKQRRDVYLLVEKRDGMRCRCCGKIVVRSAELRLDRIEHHHVHGRQIKGAESTWNIAVVCKECHDKRHLTRTLAITGNPDTVLYMEEGGKTWSTPAPKPLPLNLRSEAA